MTVFSVGAILLLCAIVAGVLIGIRSTMADGAIFHAVRDAKRFFIPVAQESTAYTFNEDLQLTQYRGRQEVPAVKLTAKSMVLFSFGQSNAANSGGERYQGQPEHVSNYFHGKYYRASDPLLGATGLGGSVWVRTANILIDRHLADNVVLMSAGVGSTSVADWAAGGRLHKMLLARLDDIPANMAVTDFLWHQGENDNPLINRKGFDGYERNMRSIIALTKQRFPQSRFIVAVASRKIDVEISPELQAIQRRLTTLPGVFLGPNTDEIGLEYRHDGTHFSGRGLEVHADGWVKAIEAANYGIESQKNSR